MVNPDVKFDGEHYFAPYDVPEYPEIPQGYLPPHVQVHIDFGRHKTRHDYAPTRAKLGGCDIYIPEAAGHDSDWDVMMNRFAKLSPDKLKPLLLALDGYDPDSFDAAEFEAICGSGKKILSVDGSSQDTTTGYQDDEEIEARLASGFASFEDGLTYMYEKEHATAHDEATRDSIMLRDLGPKIGQLINRVPRLQRKPEVFVLMRLGARHYPVFEVLAQSPHTRDQVSAETVNYRTQSSIVNRVEESLKRRIEANQPVSQQLVLAHYIANATHEVVPIDETDIERQAEGTAVRNILTQILIASRPLKAAMLLGRVYSGEASRADTLALEKACQRARTIYENPASIVTPKRERLIRRLRRK